MQIHGPGKNEGKSKLWKCPHGCPEVMPGATTGRRYALRRPSCASCGRRMTEVRR